ncbi:MAG TPA: TetR/AcrR family transcriptional regulator [Thermoleophilaceae bacterium]
MFLTMEQAATPRPLPRGPHGLERDVVLASQRGRMLGAMADAVASKGYTATTVADVVAGAGVSRKTFYEHFRDKEECFLAAYDIGVDLVLDAIVAARAPRGEESWVDLMRARVRAYLQTLAENPAFARTFLIEVFAAGPRALERRAEVLRRFAELFHDLHDEARRQFPHLQPVPERIYVAAVGAINELVSDAAREGRTAELPELEDTLLYLQVALFAGRDTAAGLGVGAPQAAGSLS